jgi:transposase
VREDGSASTVMLGLDGFVLLAVSARDGELERAVETTAVEDFCRGCGVQARLHDRRPTWVRDLPAGGRPVTLVWVKRVWRCVQAGCPVATWTETSPAIAPRASWTERARAEACRRVGQDGHSVAQVAAAFGVSWSTVMAAVRRYGTPMVDDPARLAGVHALGVDETAFLRANATRSTTYVTGMVDVRAARLLDVTLGRSGTGLSQWVQGRPQEWRDGIGVAALDPFRGYAAALRSSLPHATRVLDALHVTRLGFAAVDEVGRRMRQINGSPRPPRRPAVAHPTRAAPPRGAPDRSRLGPATGRPGGQRRNQQIAHTWIAAHDLRLIYRVHQPGAGRRAAPPVVPPLR